MDIHRRAWNGRSGLLIRGLGLTDEDHHPSSALGTRVILPGEAEDEWRAVCRVGGWGSDPGHCGERGRDPWVPGLVARPQGRGVPDRRHPIGAVALRTLGGKRTGVPVMGTPSRRLTVRAARASFGRWACRVLGFERVPERMRRNGLGDAPRGGRCCGRSARRHAGPAAVRPRPGTPPVTVARARPPASRSRAKPSISARRTLSARALQPAREMLHTAESVFLAGRLDRRGELHRSA